MFLAVKSGSILFIGFISFSTINTLERERERWKKKSHKTRLSTDGERVTISGIKKVFEGPVLNDRDSTPLQ